MAMSCAHNRSSGPHHLLITVLCIVGVSMALFDGLDDRCTRGKTNVLVWAGTSALGAFVNLLAFFAAIDIYLASRDYLMDLGVIGAGTPGCHENEELNELILEVKDAFSKAGRAIVTITLTLITRSISCFWGFKMNAGKCGKSPATTWDAGDFDLQHQFDENPVANDEDGDDGDGGDGDDGGDN